MTSASQSPTLKAIIKMEDLFSEALDKLESRIEAVSKEMSARFEKVQDSVEKVDRTIEKTGGGALATFSRIGSIVSGVGIAVIAVGKIFKGLLSIVTSVVKGIVSGITGTIRVVTRLGQSVWREAMTISKGLDEVAKMSVRIGESARFMTEYRLVTELTGTSVSALAVGLRTASKNLDDYRRGTGEAKDAFEKLGITQEMANEEIKSGGDLLEIVAGRLHLLKDETEKTAVVQKVFGRSGTELRPIFEMNVQGIRAVRREARLLGISFSEIELKRIEDMNDEISRVELAIRGLKERVLIDLAPAFTRVVAGIKEKFIALRPAILSVLESIPAAAKIVFDFIRTDPAFAFAKAAEAMYEIARFVFTQIKNLMVAAFDIALATIEERWKARFSGLRDFMQSLGLMEPTEFEKLLKIFEALERSSKHIAAGTKGQVGAFGKWYEVLKDVNGQIYQVGTGFQSHFNVTRNETGKVTKFIVQEMGKLGRVVSGQLDDLFSDSVKRNKKIILEGFRDIGGTLAKIAEEANKRGESSLDITEKIRGVFEKRLSLAKETADAELKIAEALMLDLHIMKDIGAARNKAAAPKPTPEPGAAAPGGDGGSAFDQQFHFGDPEKFRIKGFKEGFDQLVKHADAAGDSMARMGDATSQALFSSFQIKFFDPMTGKLMELEEIGKQVFRNLLNYLAEYAMREAALAIVKGIGGLFGGGSAYYNKANQQTMTDLFLGEEPFAKGAAFESGIRRWGKGGLPELMMEPTYFKTRDGKMNVGGEAGDEIIMPAARMRGGDLGVKAIMPRGAGGETLIDNRTLTINYQPQFTSPDIDGMRAEARQHEDRIRAIVHEEFGMNRGLKRMSRRYARTAY